MWHEKDISQCDDRIATYKRIEPAQCAPDISDTLCVTLCVTYILI